MNLAHKIELDITDEQRIYCAKASGCARFAYNWGLAKYQEAYEEWKQWKEKPDRDKSLDKYYRPPSSSELRKQLNRIKRDEFPWMLEVTKYATQTALINLGVSFQRFFKGHSKFPRFKKKYRRDSFYIGNDQFKVSADETHIKLPNLKSWIRLKERPRFAGTISSATVSRKADKWYVSISYELPDYEPDEVKRENQSFAGIDLGLTTFATLNSETESVKYYHLKPYRQLLSRIKRLNKSLSRKVKGSSNYYKAQAKLAKLHMRVANIRLDFLHKLSTDIIKRYDVIGIENLSIKNMTRNHKLALSIFDCGWYEFRRQLEYKAQLHGKTIVVAHKFFPSSKLCSDCGMKNKKLKLGVSEWTCQHCSSVHDRDNNAGINLRKLAVQFGRQNNPPVGDQYWKSVKDQTTYLIDEAGNKCDQV